VPKCLVSLAGRSLVDWQTAALRAANVAEIGMVVGYRGAQARGRGLPLFWNPNWRRSNMVASLLTARSWLQSGDCIVSYGDIVYHPDVVARLIDSPGDIAITCDLRWRALWEERFDRPQDDAESCVLADGRVVEIGSPVRNLDDVHAQYMGLLKLTPRGFEILLRRIARMEPSAVERVQMTQLLGALVAEGTEISGVPVEGRWCEVDRPADVALYESRLALDRRWTHDWRF
jgi:choline kinase